MPAALSITPRTANAAALLPSSVGGLYAWYKADAGVYTDAGTTLATNGQTVQQWNDQSGNGHHLSQSTSGKRPTYNTNVLNGLPVTTWAGGQCLQAASFALGTFTCLVVQKGSGTAGAVWEHGADINSNDGALLYGSQPSILVRKSAVYSARNANTTWGTQADYQLFAFRYGGTHALTQLYFGDCPAQIPTQSTNNGDPGTATTTATLNVGARNNAASVQLTGDICELIFYTPAISAVNMRGVLQYLRGRWDL
jgi:hypothetical protein